MTEYSTPVNQFLKSIDPQPYDRYLPNSFNDSLTLLEKVNKVIYSLNQTNQLSNEMVAKWNEFSNSFNLDSLNENIETKVTEFFNDDKIIQLIDNELMLDFKKEINQSTNKVITEVTSQLVESKNKSKIVGTTLNTLNNPKNGIISFITDDGQNEDYSMTMPIFRDAGVPCCSAVISNGIGDTSKYRLPLDKQLELQNDYGWEMLSHTMNHVNLSSLTDTEQEKELKGSIDRLNSLGLKCESIAYPFGFYNETSKKLARKYYRSARTVDRGLFGINYPPIDTYELKMVYLDSSAQYTNDPSGHPVNTFPFYKYYIDKAYETNGWLIITFHSGDIVSAGLQEVLAEVVNYAKTKCPIMTFSQALDVFGNTVDIGDKSETKPYLKHYAVGYNGKIDTNNLDTVFEQVNKFNGDNHIDEFEDYKITINRVSDAFGVSTNLPESAGGLLQTYKVVSRLENNIFNYQLYYTLYSNAIYKRVCNADKTWSAWIKITTSLDVTGDVGVNFNKGIETYKEGITINNASDYTLTPSQTPGTLITYKISRNSTGGYNYQEFSEYQGKRKYKRYANGTTWSTWQELTSREYYVGTDSVNGSTTIAGLPLGVSYNMVTQAVAGSSGLPESLPGTLTTHKISASSHNYNYQTYHIAGTSKMYKRSFDGTGTPTTWAKISAI